MSLKPDDEIKFAAELTISIRDGKVFVTVTDDDAASRFLCLTVDQATFVQALGGLSHVPCAAEVTALDRIGKRHEHKSFEFPLGSKRTCGDKSLAREKVWEHIPAGWTPDLGFISQGSFFTKDGEDWARTIIRRWVDKDAD